MLCQCSTSLEVSIFSSLMNISLKHLTNSKWINLIKYLFSGFFEKNIPGHINGLGQRTMTLLSKINFTQQYQLNFHHRQLRQFWNCMKGTLHSGGETETSRPTQSIRSNSGTSYTWKVALRFSLDNAQMSAFKIWISNSSLFFLCIDFFFPFLISLMLSKDMTLFNLLL